MTATQNTKNKVSNTNALLTGCENSSAAGAVIGKFPSNSGQVSGYSRLKICTVLLLTDQQSLKNAKTG